MAHDVTNKQSRATGSIIHSLSLRRNKDFRIAQPNSGSLSRWRSTRSHLPMTRRPTQRLSETVRLLCRARSQPNNSINPPRRRAGASPPAHPPARDLGGAFTRPAPRHDVTRCRWCCRCCCCCLGGTEMEETRGAHQIFIIPESSPDLSACRVAAAAAAAALIKAETLKSRAHGRAAGRHRASNGRQPSRAPRRCWKMQWPRSGPDRTGQERLMANVGEPSAGRTDL